MTLSPIINIIIMFSHGRCKLSLELYIMYYQKQVSIPSQVIQCNAGTGDSAKLSAWHNWILHVPQSQIFALISCYCHCNHQRWPVVSFHQLECTCTYTPRAGRQVLFFDTLLLWRGDLADHKNTAHTSLLVCLAYLEERVLRCDRFQSVI